MTYLTAGADMADVQGEQAADPFQHGRPRRPRALMALVVLAAVLLGAAGHWSVGAVLGTRGSTPPAPGYALATTRSGAVGANLNLSVVAHRDRVATGVNRATGVVTRVSAGSAGDLTRAGQVLFAVNERPVVAAVGDVPSYRAIGPGARGTDVAQLQALLRTAGYLAAEVDGEASSTTVEAVKQWQEDLRLPPTGVVEQGDLIFFPSLPADVTVDRKVVSLGATLVGGEAALSVLSSSPEFALPVTEAQSAQIPEGARVVIRGSAGRWVAQTAGRQQRPSGSIDIELVSPTGNSVCGRACDGVGVRPGMTYDATVIVVPRVRGTVVPVSALTTEPGGQVVVIDADGRRRAVEVLAVADGLASVKGIPAGLQVRLDAARGSPS